MKPKILKVGTGTETREIAALAREGGKPGRVWLGGYRSDMAGTKAEAFDRWCGEQGLAFTRHDYSGHGQSGGQFRDGTISRWLEESLAVFEEYTWGKQILIGSSMGGWIALRMAQELQKQGKGDRLHALLLIAPAPDFTQELFLPRLTDEQKKALERDGYLEEPSEYSDEPNLYTLALVQDGKKNAVLGGIIDPGCPVHIIQGMKDPDVPHEHAARLANHLPMSDVAMTYVKDGDHRLSRPQDIEMMLRIAGLLVAGEQD